MGDRAWWKDSVARSTQGPTGAVVAAGRAAGAGRPRPPGCSSGAVCSAISPLTHHTQFLSVLHSESLCRVVPPLSPCPFSGPSLPPFVGSWLEEDSGWLPVLLLLLSSVFLAASATRNLTPRSHGKPSAASALLRSWPGCCLLFSLLLFLSSQGLLPGSLHLCSPSLSPTKS